MTLLSAQASASSSTASNAAKANSLTRKPDDGLLHIESSHHQIAVHGLTT
jgi:hypothetical protein